MNFDKSHSSNKVVVFFGNIDRNDVDIFEYYKQDWEALNLLYSKVIFCNNPFKLVFIKYDAIFIWWWSYALLPIIISKIKNAKSYVTGTFNFKFENTSSGIDYFNKPFYKRLLIKASLKFADKNIFINFDEYIQCTSFFRMNNSCHLPHAVNDKEYSPGSDNRPHSLLNISWSGIGNLHRKGIFELLEAIALIKNMGYKIDLILAGKVGDGFEMLISKIKDLNISNEVSLLGTIDSSKKIELMRSTKIYVQPSYFEGFGLAVAEAMSCGMCIIGTNVGGMAKLISDVSITIEPGDIKNLANEIISLLSDDQRRRVLTNKSMNRIKNEYSFSSKVKKLNNILN